MAKNCVAKICQLKTFFWTSSSGRGFKVTQSKSDQCQQTYIWAQKQWDLKNLNTFQ